MPAERMMNKFILDTLNGFTVSGTKIPVAFLQYEGDSETYITFTEVDFDADYADDKRNNITHNYDFDIYTKGNFKPVASALIATLEEAGANLIPALCSADMYETDTHYYHKTLNFQFIEQEE